MTEARQDNRSMLFVGGILIGAVTAALLTPRNGQEVRKEVKEKAMSMKDKLDNKKDEIENKKNEMANKTEDKLNETQSRLQKARDKDSNTTTP